MMATQVLTRTILILLFIAAAGTRTEAQVALISSAGGHAVCEGDSVTYTCSVTGGPVLEWRALPFIPSMDVAFLPTDHIGLSAVRGPYFVATVTNKTVDVNGVVVTLTSELVAQAVAGVNGTMIDCTNRRIRQTEQLIISSEPPLPPTDLVCSAANYNCSTASAKVDVLCSWRGLSGNVPPISYNFSVDNEPHQVLMETSVSILLDCEDPNRTFAVVTTDGCGLSSSKSIYDFGLTVDECKARCTMVSSDGLSNGVIAGVVIAVLVTLLVATAALVLLLVCLKRKKAAGYDVSFRKVESDTVQMKKLQPPAPPTFLTVTDVQEHSAMFHWKLPDNEERQSPPTQIVLTVLYMNRTVCTECIIDITDGTDQVQVTELDPAVQYTASIKTCSGDGMESETTTFLYGLPEEYKDSTVTSEVGLSRMGSDSLLIVKKENYQEHSQLHKYSSATDPGTFCTKFPADLAVLKVTPLTANLKWKQWYEIREKYPDAITLIFNGKDKPFDVQSETDAEIEVAPETVYKVCLTSAFKGGTVSSLPVKFETPVLFPVVAEKEIELKKKARQFAWIEQGITLKKMTKFGSATVKVKSCQPNCPFSFRECMSDSEAVSAVYQINMTEDVTLNLRIHHCLEENQTRSMQQFAISSTSCWPPSFTTASSKDHTISIQESTGDITVSKSCWIAIIAKRSSQKKLCAHVYHQPESPLKHRVFLAFTLNLPVFAKILDQKYATHTKILELPGVADTSTSKITLDLPNEGLTMDGLLHVTRQAPSVIFLSEVTEFLSVTDAPCFELLFESTECNKPLLQYFIRINGLSTCVPVFIQLQLQGVTSDGLKSPSLSSLLSCGVVEAAADKWEMVALALGVGDQIARIQAKHVHEGSPDVCALEVFSLWLKKSIRHNLGEIVTKTIVVADSLKSFGVATDELRQFSKAIKKVMANEIVLLDSSDDESHPYTALEGKPNSLADIKKQGFFARAEKHERHFAIALGMGAYSTYIMGKGSKTEKLFTVWLRDDANVSWERLEAAAKEVGTSV